MVLSWCEQTVYFQRLYFEENLKTDQREVEICHLGASRPFITAKTKQETD